MKVSGVELTEGTLSGLGNLTRWGSAGLEMRLEEGRREGGELEVLCCRTDCVIVTFKLCVRDLFASFLWRRKKLK